jgi:sugar/nucleoside kinase (ribokinase family)
MAEFYDVNVLDAALREAGIPIDGCASDGRIDYRAEATAAQKKKGTKILADYDPDVALWGDVRKERNQLLRDSDPVMLSDYPISDDDKTAMEGYRATLRDIPQSFDSPSDVVFPSPPLSIG